MLLSPIAYFNKSQIFYKWQQLTGHELILAAVLDIWIYHYDFLMR